MSFCEKKLELVPQKAFCMSKIVDFFGLEIRRGHYSQVFFCSCHYFHRHETTVVEIKISLYSNFSENYKLIRISICDLFYNGFVFNLKNDPERPFRQMKISQTKDNALTIVNTKHICQQFRWPLTLYKLSQQY